MLGGACEEVRVRADETMTWPKDARAVLINPGAVGQPRDRDPRASFAIVDPQRRTVTWHRVAYPVERAVQAIHRAGLPPAIADRLREGR
jgi:diadenosine tetraphosphatase ApaH/serine/threonine PP2A family protein phosphatase